MNNGETMVTKKLKRLECFDGFSVSLQGSESNYSSPRKDVAIYGAIEAGFPSEEEELLLPYQEDKQLPMNESVFGWVPMKVVYDIVIKHGGWKEGGIPPMIGLTQGETTRHHGVTYDELVASPYKGSNLETSNARPQRGSNTEGAKKRSRHSTSGH